jgi:hypoxanthine phosphoribosyltransferase
VHDDIDHILLDEQDIRAGIEDVAGRIAQHYADDEPTVVSVLNGSVVFVSDLIRRLPISLRLAFLWAESYRQGTDPGALSFGGVGNASEIQGRRVLLVDDILDSGRTLGALRGELLRRGARDVRTCVFLDKPARRAVALEADYVGFRIADEFVVGYGLDFAGRYRNLPFVGVLKAHVRARVLSASAGEERR